MSDLELMFNPETGKWSEAPEYKLEIYFQSKAELEECRKKLIEGKYDWHDLRENNRDLPESAGRMVRVCLEGTGLYNAKSLSYCDAFIGYGDMEWYTPDHDKMRRAKSICDNRIAECYKVIAWREIEPFEGGCNNDE